LSAAAKAISIGVATQLRALLVQRTFGNEAHLLLEALLMVALLVVVVEVQVQVQDPARMQAFVRMKGTMETRVGRRG